MARKHNIEWWGPPRDYTLRPYERKISWLELFYDLVYVAAISQLTHHLAAHPTWPTAGFSFLLFAMIFWSWVNGSQYYDLHGTDSIRTRLVTFWQMLAVAAVAITLRDAYLGAHRAFAFSFAMVQIMITYLWWSVGFYDPSHRVFSRFYTFNYLLAFALLIVSGFTDRETAVALWVAVLILDLTPPLTVARTIRKVLGERGQEFSASATIVERFGLFTIIVLAESILATVSGIAELERKPPGIWAAFILSIFIAFLLWSLYFDMTSEQEAKKGYGNAQRFNFLHFPLLAALSVVGACIKVLLSHSGEMLDATVCWMICVALTTILYLVVAITRVMEEHEEDRSYIRPVSRLLQGIGAMLLLVPLFCAYLTTVKFLSILALILLVPVLVGIRSWVLFRFFGENS